MYSMRMWSFALSLLFAFGLAGALAAPGLYAQEGYRSFSSRLQSISSPVAPGSVAYGDYLIRKGDRLLPGKPDSALVFFRLAARWHKQIAYTEGLAKAYQRIAVSLRELKEYQQASHYLELAIALPYVPDRTMRMKEYITLCDLHNSAGNFRDIPPVYLQALPLFNPADSADIRPLARLHKYMAIAHLRAGSYDSAFYYYFHILEELQSPDSLSELTFIETYAGLGATFSSSGDYMQALHYFEKMKALAVAYRDTNQINMALSNIVNVYMDMKDYEKVKALGPEALAVARKLKYYNYQSATANALAVAMNEEGNYKVALIYGKEAYGSALKDKRFDEQISGSYTLGYTYLKMKNYGEAEHYLLPAVQLARSRGRVDNIAEAYSQLADIYSHTGRYREAYEYVELYSRIRDSLRGKESAERYAHVELKYRTAEKDRQLARQQLQLNQKEHKLRDKNIWIGGISLSGLFVLLILAGRYRNKQKLQRKQLQNLRQQQEIERLHSRMQGEEVERERIARELHDGVSVLLAAAKMNYMSLSKEYTVLDSSETYQEVLRLLNGTLLELRSVSYNLVPELLIRQSLPAAVQAFCELMQKGHQLRIGMQAYGSYLALDPRFSYAVYRIVQELVHNIVKHARATEVLIQMILHDDQLHLAAEDNGVGFVEEQSAAGMGLQNLRSRVAELQGQLSFSSIPGTGTTVEIEIPVHL